MAKLSVPVVVTVIGEGGSGGALAIGVGDQVLMLENAIYSVISPEGCAAILWKDSSQSARAAEGLKLTAGDLKHEGIVDQVIEEPKAARKTRMMKLRACWTPRCPPAWQNRQLTILKSA
jgi:acetyl-CoA carboxylase carboxyl transferase subunit alpha